MEALNREDRDGFLREDNNNNNNNSNLCFGPPSTAPTCYASNKHVCCVFCRTLVFWVKPHTHSAAVPCPAGLQRIFCPCR